MLQVTNSEDRTTRYSYDERNQMASVTDHDENVSTFNYDGLGREVNRNLANGNTISRSFDGDGNLTEIANQNSDGVFSSFEYAYDKNGNKTSQIEEDGAQTTYKYDVLNRLVEVLYSEEKIRSLKQASDTPEDGLNEGQDEQNKQDKVDEQDEQDKQGKEDKQDKQDKSQQGPKEKKSVSAKANTVHVSGNGNDKGNGNGKSSGNGNNKDKNNDNGKGKNNNNGKGKENKGNNGKGNKGNKGKNEKPLLVCGSDGTLEINEEIAEEINVVDDLPDYLIEPQSKVQYTDTVSRK